MGWIEFAATVISAAAWPAAVVVIALVFRRKIIDALDSDLTEITAGPFAARWDRAAMEARAAVEIEAADAAPLEVGGTEEADSTVFGRLRGLVAGSPELAVIGAYQAVEHRLRQVADIARRRTGETPRRRPSFDRDLDDLFPTGVISQASTILLDSLRRLRNLAVHDPADVTAEQAAEYLVLAAELMIHLDQAEMMLRRMPEDIEEAE